ncbi:MAG: alpha/beta fold hydrolase [Candidatus Saccharibacteria bacterium]
MNIKNEADIKAEEHPSYGYQVMQKMWLTNMAWMNAVFGKTGMMVTPAYPPTGCTPKEVIWQHNKAKLYRYQSKSSRQYRTPILFLYALINKPYILDMIPGISMIEYLTNQGYDVYLLDWGEFHWDDRETTFDDLVYDYVAPAVERVAEKAQAGDISVIGYCMGGTIAAMYLPLFKQSSVRNLVCMGAPVDFSDSGVADVLLDARWFDTEKVHKAFPLVPKNLVAFGASLLDPAKNYFGQYASFIRTLAEHSTTYPWLAFYKWKRDGIHFPGEAFNQWVRDFYQSNKLIADKIKLRGKKVKLADINANLLVLAGANDNIVPRHQARALMDVVSSKDKEYREYPVDHQGMVFGRIAKYKVYPELHEWLNNRSNKL